MKLFPKTFCYTLMLMIIITLIGHGLMYFLIPAFYTWSTQLLYDPPEFSATALLWVKYQSAFLPFLLKSRRAYDGEQALELFNSKEIDLVVLDIMLPQINGLNVLKKIRQASRPSHSAAPAFLPVPAYIPHRLFSWPPALRHILPAESLR